MSERFSPKAKAFLEQDPPEERLKAPILDVFSPNPELALWQIGLEIEDATEQGASEKELEFLELAKRLAEASFIERDQTRAVTQERFGRLISHRRKNKDIENGPYDLFGNAKRQSYVYILASKARWALIGRNPDDYPEDSEYIEREWAEAASHETQRREAEAARNYDINRARELLDYQE